MLLRITLWIRSSTPYCSPFPSPATVGGQNGISAITSSTLVLKHQWLITMPKMPSCSLRLVYKKLQLGKKVDFLEVYKQPPYHDSTQDTN
ncbi:hypothetical protein L6452_32964 [Arctium lappa]|uniref:Uncharacterized protein n=1 Tax=Arctium lappa TaxID=4217 RepID=A0ACB8Z559_ARCLA|nr:hypothetical protein L6452_32964 [Arctium lappa]